MEWQDLFTALALVLVIEGIFPFINPEGIRRTMALVSQLSDQQLRMTGLVCMTVGLVVLYLVN